jgi:hypothetical protein
VKGSGGIQARRGLIQHENGGVDKQLMANGDTLALATRDTTAEEATWATAIPSTGDQQQWQQYTVHVVGGTGSDMKLLW